RFAKREEQPNLAVRHRQARTKRRDTARKQRGSAFWADRQTDVGGAYDLECERTNRLAGLAGDHKTAYLADKSEHRPGHGVQLSAQLIGDLSAQCLTTRCLTTRCLTSKGLAVGGHG